MEFLKIAKGRKISKAIYNTLLLFTEKKYLWGGWVFENIT